MQTQSAPITVQLGTRVKVKYPGTKREEEFYIPPKLDAKLSEGKPEADSPWWKCFGGRKIGDTVEVPVRGEDIAIAEIIAIR